MDLSVEGIHYLQSKRTSKISSCSLIDWGRRSDRHKRKGAWAHVCQKFESRDLCCMLRAKIEVGEECFKS